MVTQRGDRVPARQRDLRFESWTAPCWWATMAGVPFPVRPPGGGGQADSSRPPGLQRQTGATPGRDLGDGVPGGNWGLGLGLPSQRELWGRISSRLVAVSAGRVHRVITVGLAVTGNCSAATRTCASVALLMALGNPV